MQYCPPRSPVCQTWLPLEYPEYDEPAEDDRGVVAGSIPFGHFSLVRRAEWFLHRSEAKFVNGTNRLCLSKPIRGGILFGFVGVLFL